MVLSRTLVGVYVLECEVDVGDLPAPTGAQVLSYAVADGAPITYPVAVIEARVHIGRATVYAVGGAGGLRSQVQPIDYAQVSPRVAFADICRDSVLRDSAGAPALVNGLPVPEVPNAVALAALGALPRLARWSRPAGTGAGALRGLCRALRRLTGQTYSWRVLRDGTVWLGTESWPAYVASSGQTEPPYYTEEPHASGIGTAALDAPDLDPGVTVLPPDDWTPTGASPVPLQISGVRYTLDEDGTFRALVEVASAEAPQGRERSYFARAVEGAIPKQALRVPWAATVIAQDSDGALGLRFDDDGAPMLTLSAVPYWPGLPGMAVQVPMGARCLVQWVGGREESPVVTGWAPNTAVTSLTVSGNGEAGSVPGVQFARVDDTVDVGTLSAKDEAGHDVIFTWQRTGQAAVTNTAIQIVGAISSGSTQLRG